jgi:hypothetical protein
MAISVSETNLGTVSTSEVNLYGSTQTDDKVVQVGVLVDSCANGDLFAIRAYETVNASLRLVEEWVIGHVIAATSPHIIPPVALGIGWQYRVIKLAGTDRNVRVVVAEVS